jgi:hypothetical protein
MSIIKSKRNTKINIQVIQESRKREIVMKIEGSEQKQMVDSIISKNTLNANGVIQQTKRQQLTEWVIRK